MSIQDYYALTGLSQLAAACSLEWGGTWTDFPDIPHFQDAAYKIPPKEGISLRQKHELSLYKTLI